MAITAVKRTGRGDVSTMSTTASTRPAASTPSKADRNLNRIHATKEPYRSHGIEHHGKQANRSVGHP